KRQKRGESRRPLPGGATAHGKEGKPEGQAHKEARVGQVLTLERKLADVFERVLPEGSLLVNRRSREPGSQQRVGADDAKSSRRRSLASGSLPLPGASR